MSRLSAAECAGLKSILDVMSEADLLALCDTVTNKKIEVKNATEAASAVLLYTQDAEELLKRRKVQRDFIFKYLAAQNVVVSPTADKNQLVKITLQQWRSTKAVPTQVQEKSKYPSSAVRVQEKREHPSPSLRKYQSSAVRVDALDRSSLRTERTVPTQVKKKREHSAVRVPTQVQEKREHPSPSLRKYQSSAVRVDALDRSSLRTERTVPIQVKKKREHSAVRVQEKREHPSPSLRKYQSSAVRVYAIDYSSLRTESTVPIQVKKKRKHSAVRVGVNALNHLALKTERTVQRKREYSAVGVGGNALGSSATQRKRK